MTRELFISVIEALRLQSDRDRAAAAAIGSVFGYDSLNPYDSSLVSAAAITVLQLHFPPGPDGCEIERYCYVLNFGFRDGQRVIEPDDLWVSLTGAPRGKGLYDKGGPASGLEQYGYGLDVLDHRFQYGPDAKDQ